MFKNILIAGHSNIGDVCCDLVVVGALSNQYPQAKITFLTSPRSRDLVDGYPGIDQMIVFDKNGNDKGIKGRINLITSLIRQKFDCAVILKNSVMYNFLGIPKVWSLNQ